MTKCVVEGCDQEYDVTCSFSFYNVNTSSESETLRQEWIESAMQKEAECLWRHISVQLCGYHFEVDNQGLWLDSPALPDLLTASPAPAPTLASQHKPDAIPFPEAEELGGIKGQQDKDSFQGLFEQFIRSNSQCKDAIRLDHNYSMPSLRAGGEGGAGGVAGAGGEGPSRLNVRQLVDTLGNLSLKNLQRKQLWVVRVDKEGHEASIAQSEQVITKVPDPCLKQMIQIIPGGEVEVVGVAPAGLGPVHSEVLEVVDEGACGVPVPAPEGCGYEEVVHVRQPPHHQGLADLAFDSFVYGVPYEADADVDGDADVDVDAEGVADVGADGDVDADATELREGGSAGDGAGAGGGGNKRWTVRLVSEGEVCAATGAGAGTEAGAARPKYAFIKNCSTGKKRRHFTTEVSEITIPGGFENLYILPDADPALGVEVTTSGSVEAAAGAADKYVVGGYEELVLGRDERWLELPRKRRRPARPARPARRLALPPASVDWAVSVPGGAGAGAGMGADAVADTGAVDAADAPDECDKAGRVRRKNKKYHGYDFVT